MSLSANHWQPNGISVVLLDRDGVINRKAAEGSYIHNAAELELLAGVPEAIRRLNQAGILTIVITNQRGIALGRFTEQDLAAIHASLKVQLAEHGAHLDAIYHCPHNYGECNCRKPQTGMLEQAFRDFPLARRDNTVLIGDSANDMEAGRSFGIATILIGSEHTHIQADARAASLLDAVEHIVLCAAAVPDGG